MIALIGDDVNSVKRISLVGEMSTFLTSGFMKSFGGRGDSPHLVG